jgi:hypothetical protein
MARRATISQMAEAQENAGSTPMGGAMGVVVTENTADTKELAGQLAVESIDPLRVVDHPPVKKFMVCNPSGIDVMIGTGKTLLKRGKVVDSVTYDIDRLRAMGVQLEEVG